MIPKNIQGPIFNQDSTDFFFVRSAAQMSGEAVDAYIDDLQRAGIGTFISCVNAMRANYASQVWETDWHSYEPAGPDDQPVLRCLPPAAIAPTRNRLDAAKRLADLGINFHARALARCRYHGIGAWVTVRLNDVHDCMTEESPLLSTFYKAQRTAQQLRAPHRGQWWPEMGLDWERPEVQEHYFKLVREQLETLDLDGIELDWMRFVFHFRVGRELAGGQAITAWTERVRLLCAAAAQRLGHPVKLAVRVPSRPETARRLGLDAVAWARAGLVDLVVPTPFWSTSDFDIPVGEWRRLLDGTGVQLAPGMEVRYQPVPNGPAQTMSAELATGLGLTFLHGGADQVYLFNFFPAGHGLVKAWGLQKYETVIRAMRSAEELIKLPRVHAVTYRDVRAPGEAADHALPARDPGEDFQHPPGCAIRVQTGPKPTKVQAVELSLEFAVDSVEPAKLHVYVNSVACAAKPGTTAPLMTYDVPAEILEDEAQVVEVVGGAPNSYHLVRVELAVDGG